MENYPERPEGAIVTTELGKNFGDRRAVAGITLTVSKGELFGFLGPNGAGKTTMIRLLVGLLRPSQGEAFIGGFNVVTESLEARRVVGYVPDQPALYDKLTGTEMLALAGDLYKVDRGTQKRRIPELLEEFDLQEQRNELVGSYSRGMRQKLGLSCALLHEPEVLFLDEPTVGLDPAGLRQLKDVLRGLVTTGKTVFLSTHGLEVAELLCDRVGIVQKGRLLAVDSPKGFRERGGDSSLEEAFLRMTVRETEESK